MPGGNVRQIEIEQTVIGAMLLNSSVLDEVCGLITPADFSQERNRQIYQAAIALYSDGKPVDFVTVAESLTRQGLIDKCGGPAYLMGLSDHVGTSAHAPYYARLLRERAVIRLLKQRGQEIIAACDKPVESVAELLDHVESRVYDLLETRRTGSAKFLEALVPVEMDLLEKTFYEKGDLGLQTGFLDLDRLTGGFYPGDLIILAARPGHGKTAWGLNIAHHAAENGKTVGFVSLEMTGAHLVRRLMAAVGHIDGERLKRVSLTPDEWARLATVAEALKALPLHIDDGAQMTVLDIRSRARRLKLKHGLDLLIVDYLQLIRPTKAGRSREQELSAVSGALKALAKELSIPVFAVSQLNREIEKRDSKVPRLSDLRESGALEQDADLVMFMWREGDNPVAQVNIAKQRNGRTGKFRLLYTSEHLRFDNYFEE